MFQDTTLYLANPPVNGNCLPSSVAADIATRVRRGDFDDKFEAQFNLLKAFAQYSKEPYKFEPKSLPEMFDQQESKNIQEIFTRFKNYLAEEGEELEKQFNPVVRSWAAFFMDAKTQRKDFITTFCSALELTCALDDEKSAKRFLDAKNYQSLEKSVGLELSFKDFFFSRTDVLRKFEFSLWQNLFEELGAKIQSERLKDDNKWPDKVGGLIDDLENEDLSSQWKELHENVVNNLAEASTDMALSDIEPIYKCLGFTAKKIYYDSKLYDSKSKEYRIDDFDYSKNARFVQVTLKERYAPLKESIEGLGSKGDMLVAGGEAQHWMVLIPNKKLARSFKSPCLPGEIVEEEESSLKDTESVYDSSCIEKIESDEETSSTDIEKLDVRESGEVIRQEFTLHESEIVLDDDEKREDQAGHTESVVIADVKAVPKTYLGWKKLIENYELEKKFGVHTVIIDVARANLIARCDALKTKAENYSSKYYETDASLQNVMSKAKDLFNSPCPNNILELNNYAAKLQGHSSRLWKTIGGAMIGLSTATATVGTLALVNVLALSSPLMIAMVAGGGALLVIGLILFAAKGCQTGVSYRAKKLADAVEKVEPSTLTI